MFEVVSSLEVLVSSAALRFTDRLFYSEGYNAFCLCRALAKKGIGLTILAPSVDVSTSIKGATIVPMGKFETVQKMRYYSYNWLKYNLRMLTKSKRIIKDIDPDLIHHIFPSWIDFGYSLFPIFNSTKPFVYGPILTQRGVDMKRASSPKDRLLSYFRRSLLSKVYEQTLRRATRVIVSVDDALDHLPHFVREKSVTICHGVDTKFFAPRVSRKDDSRFNVVFLGRWIPPKGIPVAIKAISLVKHRIPNILFKIYGSGPQRAELEVQIKAEGLDGSVQFPGFVEDENLPAALCEADVLCCPSLEDASPSVILQGMACGVPIIATKVGGIPEMVSHGENGLLVEPNDPKALSEALMRLFGYPEAMREMGKNGRARAERVYDWGVIAQKISEVYEVSIRERR